MDQKDIQSFSEQTVNRYSSRFKEMQHSIRTLGWGTKEQQEFRFVEVLKRLDATGKSVLDIGCGFGDLFNFMQSCDFDFEKYIGWDITPDFIENPLIIDKNIELKVWNIAEEQPSRTVADIGIMLGLLNWNWKNEEKNYDYSTKVIRNAFEAVNDVLVIDFLSTQTEPNYPKEEIVFYHDPLIMLSKAMEITPNVDLVHSYPSIPQKEFLLYLYK